MLKALVRGRLQFTPRADERGRFYEIKGEGTVEAAIAALAPQYVASPTGFEPVFRP